MEIGPILRSMRRNKARLGLLAVEIALTLAVVVNCITLIADARAKMARASGFDDQNLLSVQVVPYASAFRDDAYRRNRVGQDVNVLRALPGVRAAANTPFKPWQGGGSSTEMRVEGAPSEQLFRTQIYPVDDGIVDTLGVHLVAGRAFDRGQVDVDTGRLTELLAADRPPREQRQPFRQEVVISKALADLAFPDGVALGKALEDPDGDLYPVVGVIDPFYNPYGWPIHEYVVLYANWSGGYAGGARFLVRSEPGQLEAVASQVDQALIAAHDGRNVTVQPITAIREEFFSPSSVVSITATGMMGLLVFVTGLGIAGMTSFNVTERTKQIGTRRALGARRLDIVQHFLLENWLVTTAGALLGVALAFAFNLLLVNFVTGAKVGAMTMVLGVLALWLTGLLAALLPALRGARVSPAVATRSV